MIARYENAQNMRFSGQSFLWFQICEYSEGLSRYFVVCQSLRVYHDVSSGHVFHPLFLSRSRLSPRGRAVYFCPLPLPTECCDVPSCAVSVAVSSRSVSEGADAAVSARATLYPSKSERGQRVMRNKLLKNVKSGVDIIIMVIIHAVSAVGCLFSAIYR